VDYSSKAKSFNVRGIGTIFYTCSNSGHLFPFDFKNLVFHFPRNFNRTIYTILILYVIFWNHFWKRCEIFSLLAIFLLREYKFK
jgi:hypothetical protein